MDEFDRRMDALRLRFRARAAADAGALRDAWAERDLDALRRIAHGLAGNAGLFGYSELGDAARALDDALGTPVEDAQLAPRLEAILALIPAA